MKKILVIAIVALLATSCSKSIIMPKAVNTISTASYSDLNLERSDYEIVNTVNADAAITYVSNRKGDRININGVSDNFSLEYTYKPKKKIGLFSFGNGWTCTGTGILKLGYLSNDYVDSFDPNTMCAPEILARRLAIYRAINQVKVEGGDGLIEPTISTNVEQTGQIITYKTTVTAKIIKLK